MKRSELEVRSTLEKGYLNLISVKIKDSEEGLEYGGHTYH